MKIRRLIAVMKKEFIHIRRDPLSLAIAFLMPMMQLLIYGYAITFDVNNISMVVYDQDKSRMSRELISSFRESGYFTIVSYVSDFSEIDTAIETGRARVAIAIPPRFSEDMTTGKGSEVGTFIDGSDSNTATIAENYILGIGKLFEGKMRVGPLRQAVDVRTRVWYNPDMVSTNFIIPGLIALIMAIIIALLTSLTIAREWERGTMEQLISTPVKTSELIAGKLIPYFIIGFIDILFCIITGIFWFNVPFNGSFFLLISLSSLFLFGGVSFGILISINARGSQAVATQMALLSTFLPAFLLSGFMYAISNMPKFLQIITYAIPARYYVTISKGIFLKGSSLDILKFEVFFLMLYGILVFTAANKKLRKRME